MQGIFHRALFPSQRWETCFHSILDSNEHTKDFGDSVELVDVAVAGEQGASGDHFRVQAARRPDVHRFPVPRIAQQEFRRPVLSGGHVIRAGLVGSVHEARESEVAQLYHSVRRHEDVLRFNVAMHDLRESCA